ncbi:sugar kinase [Pseudoalteromonas sp. MSK9-3]|uniref:ROK family protein n=1 Tax=Pseudoalteromonas sp. MSK9-3 TaxID=1897633 RepID=UPI000E6C196A|nr:ROK family protein [Pseudoalteromonas sp. MSK9-3]RJE78403.1 sugar kinase [Pseudoalteromonas sp. MSK9-3]
MSGVLCIDLGGTKAHVAEVSNNGLGKVHRYDVPSRGSKQAVLAFIEQIIAVHLSVQCMGISLGVPSSVRVADGYIIETVNIPNLHSVSLKEWLYSKFGLPVVVHNDANCFTFGEYQYGSHLPCNNLIGITLGTGLGSGVVLNGELYIGSNGFAGEFGSFTYLEGIVEEYTSGQFFKLLGLDGAQEAEKAKLGDTKSKALFNQFGQHLGHAISLILLAFDPDKIVLGGSVTQSYSLFKSSLFSSLSEHSHEMLVSHLCVQPSRLQYAPLLGSFALFINEIPHAKEVLNG